MLARRPGYSFMLVLLFLVRGATTPLVADCSPSHHTEQPAPASDMGHETDHAAPTDAPPCPHDDHHNSMDCGLMVGCSQSVSMTAPAVVPPAPTDQRDPVPPVSQQVHPQPVAPTSPPPKS